MTQENASAAEDETLNETVTPEALAPEEAPAQEADAHPEAEAVEEGPSLEQENLMLKDQLLRAVAETENLRKRSQRELEEANKYAVTGFAREMVNVMENLHRAVQCIPASAREGDDAVKSIAEGVEMTLRELEQIFERFKITRVNPEGEKFDHNQQQAVAQVESAEVPEGHVVQVLQAGYTLHDRLLRPAMVAVSKGAPGAPTTGVDTQA